MNDEHRDAAIANVTKSAATTAVDSRTRPGRLRLWVNWVLALLTVPAAAVVLIYALGALMSTAACSDQQCPDWGPGGIVFGVLFYGAPVVAVVAIVVSFFPARRRWGIVVGVSALALLAADIVVLAVAFRQ